MSELVHVRAIPADDLRYRDGVLTGRIVPYNTSTQVVDRLPDGSIDLYWEGVRPEAFSRQLSADNPGVIRRVELVHTHDGGLGFLGHARSIESKPDGAHATFTIIRSRREDVADLIDSGINELSIEYRERPNGTQIDDDGVRWRTAAHLDRVALEAQGAYAGAQVLAYRAEADEFARETAERRAAEAAEAAEQERQRVAAADAEAALQARRQQLADQDAFLAAAQARQAELAARYRI